MTPKPDPLDDIFFACVIAFAAMAAVFVIVGTHGLVLIPVALAYAGIRIYRHLTTEGQEN